MRNTDTIGRRIRSVREAKGYSQEYMAEMLGTCQSTYANLELGKSSLSVERLLRIADILTIDVHQLFDLFASQQKPPPVKSKKENSLADPLPVDIKQVYDQLIYELRTEIDFLRSLVRHQHE